MAAQNSFGKALASADKSVRDKAVKKLSKYLSNKKELSDLDLLKLWKGLFYCFWMSDKPLVQQQLSEKLASLILKIPDEIALKFVEAFWKEIRLEWNGIDRLRLDKFYYLFRQMHLNSFKFLEKVNWDVTHVIKYMDIYTDGPLSLLDQTVPPSLLYHACEVFIPELEKAISKPIPSSVFIDILEPFFDVVGFCSNDILVERVIEEIFLNIVNIYENEDANEEEESNVIKSCNFKSIYKRLEKLSGEPLILKKNVEQIESLIVIFKGLAETQEVLQGDDDENLDEEEEQEEIEEVVEEEQINDEEVEVKEEQKDEEEEEIEEIKTTPKSRGRGRGKKATTTKGKKGSKKEDPVEVEKEEKQETKKTQRKRKAPTEPIEIEEKEIKEENDVEVIESPKKKKKSTPKATAKKNTKTSARGKSKAKEESEQEVIEIKESDEEEQTKPKVDKNIKTNNKKTSKKISKEVTSESKTKIKSKSKTKSKSTSTNNNKDKKVKTSKSKEKGRQLENVVEEENDPQENHLETLNDIKLDQSITSKDQPSPITTSESSPINPDTTTTSASPKPNKKSKKTKKSKKSKKSTPSTTTTDTSKTQSTSSDDIIEIPSKSKSTKKSKKKEKEAEITIPKIAEKTIKKSKTKKTQKKKKKEKVLSEEEAFANKILKEVQLLGDSASKKSKSKSISTSLSTTTTSNSSEKIPEKIKIESLITPTSTYQPPKGPKGQKRSRAIDFF